LLEPCLLLGFLARNSFLARQPRRIHWRRRGCQAFLKGIMEA
jgi:hypothetical protein